MDSTSLAYREGNFTEIFEAARSSRLRKDEMIAYSQSLEKLRDTQRGIQYAAEQASAEARAEGLAEGRAEGRAQGRAEEKIEIARKMIESGIATETISLFTGLSISEISNL